MLKNLSIKNYALIDDVSIAFQDELSVITGETGAGKSILLGALSLILGKRADHQSLKDSDKKCIIEGVFDIKEYGLQTFFENHDLDYEEITLIRREINKQGKNRNFINDSPTSLEVLKELSSLLIDIHSQNQLDLINRTSFQFNFIDAVSKNNELSKEYQSTFYLYQKAKKKLAGFKEKLNNSIKEKDFLQFQFQEISELNLLEGENEELENEQGLLANSEQIKSTLLNSIQLINQEEYGVSTSLNALVKNLETLGNVHPILDELNKRSKAVFIELSDIEKDLERIESNLEINPIRLAEIEERLREIHRLKTKHQLTNSDELLQLQKELEIKLNTAISFEEEIHHLEKELVVLKNHTTKIAEELSVRRKKSIGEIQNEIVKSLNELGIPHGQFELKLEELNHLNEFGKDKVEFLFSANLGMAPGNIANTASGGELSRLMLAIKKLLAENKKMPTIIFDEIDTGVSGEIANKMALQLKSMGKGRQVISISHLPQIAAKGKHHFKVYKEVSEQRTTTKIELLNTDQRIQELAKMLSGAQVSDASLNNAKELINNN